MKKEDIKELEDKGFITIDGKGEMHLTEEGMKHSQELLKEDGGARQYLKQTMKYFDNNKPDKETVNKDEIADELDRVDNTKISIFERFGIPVVDDLRNYQLFCKILGDFEKEEVPKGLKTKRMKEGYKQVSSLFKTQYDLLSRAKYFEIPENVNLILANTKNEVSKVRFPYYFSFLDTSLIVYDRLYYSFLVTDFDSFYEKNKLEKDGKDRIHILTFYETEEGIGYDDFNLYKKENNKYRNKIREYMMNFVNFINNEDVKLMFREKTEKNQQRRVDRGRVPLPSFNKIYVVGYLKKYLDKLESQELGTRFSHRFWVRGHFRRFLDKKKYNKLYKQYEKGELRNVEGKKYSIEEGFLKIWVYPYIKGEGMLIDKKYKLK